VTDLGRRATVEARALNEPGGLRDVARPRVNRAACVKGALQHGLDPHRYDGSVSRSFPLR